MAPFDRSRMIRSGCPRWIFIKRFHIIELHSLVYYAALTALVHPFRYNNGVWQTDRQGQTDIGPWHTPRCALCVGYVASRGNNNDYHAPHDLVTAKRTTGQHT